MINDIITSKTINITQDDMLNGATINDGWKCQLTKSGRICHLSLGFIPNTTDTIIIYQLPEEFRPKVQVPVNVGALFRQSLVGSFPSINPNGNISIVVPSNQNVTWTINVTWSVD